MEIRVPSENYFLNIEAEDMDNLNHPIAYDVSSGAWAGAYVTSGTSNESAHSFYISKNDNYAIWVRISDENNNADAVKLSINGGEEIILGDDALNNPLAFRWVDFKNGNPEDKLTISLTQGKYTLNLKDIEPGTKIDSIIITNDLNFIPPDTPPGISSWAKIADNVFTGTANSCPKLKARVEIVFVGYYAPYFTAA